MYIRQKKGPYFILFMHRELRCLVDTHNIVRDDKTGMTSLVRVFKSLLVESVSRV